MGKILGDRYRPERAELFNHGPAWPELVRKTRDASALRPDRYREKHYGDLIPNLRDEIRRMVD